MAVEYKKESCEKVHLQRVHQTGVWSGMLCTGRGRAGLRQGARGQGEQGGGQVIGCWQEYGTTCRHSGVYGLSLQI